MENKKHERTQVCLGEPCRFYSNAGCSVNYRLAKTAKIDPVYKGEPCLHPDIWELDLKTTRPSAQ